MPYGQKNTPGLSAKGLSVVKLSFAILFTLPTSHELGLKVLCNLNKDTIQIAFCQVEINDIGGL